MLGEYCLSNPKQIYIFERVEAAIHEMNMDSPKEYWSDNEVNLMHLDVFLNPRAGSSKLDIVVFGGYAVKSKYIRIIFDLDLIESIDDSVECAIDGIKREFDID